VVNPDDLLAAALRYAERGYRVFPCIPGTKHPITQHGFHDAPTDPGQIERWWSRHPRANVGIAAEGMLVVDIDGADNPWQRRIWLQTHQSRNAERVGEPTRHVSVIC
jgi:hypothetical protein